VGMILLGGTVLPIILSWVFLFPLVFNNCSGKKISP